MWAIHLYSNNFEPDREAPTTVESGSAAWIASKLERRSTSQRYFKKEKIHFTARQAIWLGTAGFSQKKEKSSQEATAHE